MYRNATLNFVGNKCLKTQTQAYQRQAINLLTTSSYAYVDISLVMTFYYTLDYNTLYNLERPKLRAE